MQPVRKVQLRHELLDLWPEVSDASDDSGDDAYAQDGLLVLGRTIVLVAFGLIGAGELVVALFRAGLLVIRGSSSPLEEPEKMLSSEDRSSMLALMSEEVPSSSSAAPATGAVKAPAVIIAAAPATAVKFLNFFSRVFPSGL